VSAGAAHPARGVLGADLDSLQPPFALVDLDALRANAADLLRRARGKPVRVASKSVRCRALLEGVLGHADSRVQAPRRDPGGSEFRGLMTFTLPESLWLHEHGFDDVLLAYPTADREALGALGRVESERPPAITVDSVDHLDLVDAAAGARGRAVRVCIEFDTSLELAGGRMRIGPLRSPLRTPEQVASLAREIVARPGFELAGVMGYEGHVAGVGDRPPNPLLAAAVRAMQRAARAQVAERRAAVVEAVGRVAPVEIVNGGGTGSLESTADERVVTEVSAGSGLYGPALFDRYAGFRPRPAAMFCLPVARRPDARTATLSGGGYPASGPAGADRLPVPHLPSGLRLTRLEGAGEVQTPVRGPAAGGLRVGDRVYMRHAKAGELCERFASLYLVAGGRVVDEVPTYRGEGRTEL